MEVGYTRVRSRTSWPSGGYRINWVQTGVKQKPFVNKPLPYTVVKYVQTRYDPIGNNPIPPSGADSSAFWDGANGNLPEYDRVLNKARAKFMDMITARAQIGATIAEYKSSFDMIGSRANQLFRSYRAFKRGRFRQGLAELRIPPLQKHKNKTWNRPREASSLWLEYWFGWSPLVNDIYTAVDTLQSPVPNITIKASSGTRVVRRRNASSGGLHDKRECSVLCVHKVQGQVRVSNPNLFEANRLGLINPVAIAWELVPFSFLVDWFIPIGNFLEGWTDTAGLEFSNMFRTRFLRGESDYTMTANTGTPYFRGKIESSTMMQVHRVLLTEPPPASVVVSIPTRLSVTRAATSIALLVGLFSPKK